MSALEQLAPLVQAELQRIARHYLQDERPGHLLQPAALVNEAWLRLIDWRNVSGRNRAHFFSVAAQLMRRVLVDEARERQSLKRGGDVVRVSLSAAAGVGDEQGAELPALDAALHELARLDARKSRIVELRFFGGLSVEETAEVLQLSVRTVLREAIEFGLQICAALAAEHAAGIIHRDLKPENAMLRHDGYVKVLDFGLAKRSEGQTFELSTSPSSLTNPGTVMGTVSYMSPEQARGQKVDARTDIFSLGIVLYEMLAGHLPFEGETISDMLAAILKSEPLPLPMALNDALPDAPDALQQIITQALVKLCSVG